MSWKDVGEGEKGNEEITYSTLISASEKGKAPDAITYSALTRACEKGKQSERA